ncbi:MAG: GntR family transcriptional regulator [Rhizobiaceae bacterium]|nr:GntR family transcriptional regulator [Rhizobiaceae bacterium]
MIPAKKEDCRAELVRRILTLEIAPGSMLDEAALSEEFGLSRTPLREVYQSLAGDGYLALLRNRGAKVSSMDLDSMRSFFQTAPMIYSAVGRLAAENATSAQLAELREVQYRFRKVCEGGETREMAIYNHRFHEIIGEMAGSVYLAPSLRRLLIDHTRMSQKFYKPVNSKERLLVWDACDQHDAMIVAIENNDAEAMVKLTLEHWELSRNRIEKFSRPDPLDFDLEQAG